MTAKAKARKARKFYFTKLAVKARLRSRLIVHFKRGEKAVKLKRAYHRAIKDCRAARLAYLAAKVKANAPLGAKALAQARKDLGVVESGGNNRGPGVVRIIKTGGGREGDAWCAWAVIAWYKLAGSVANWSVTYGGVKNLDDVVGVVRTRFPRAGAIVRYVFDHTGLFVCWCNAAGRRRPRLLATHIKAIEGNTGSVGAVSDSSNGADGVKEKIRPKVLVADYLKASR